MLSGMGSRFKRNIAEATDKNGRLLKAGMVEHIEMEGRGGWASAQTRDG